MPILTPSTSTTRLHIGWTAWKIDQFGMTLHDVGLHTSSLVKHKQLLWTTVSSLHWFAKWPLELNTIVCSRTSRRWLLQILPLEQVIFETHLRHDDVALRKVDRTNRDLNRQTLFLKETDTQYKFEWYLKWNLTLTVDTQLCWLYTRLEMYC